MVLLGWVWRLRQFGKSILGIGVFWGLMVALVIAVSRSLLPEALATTAMIALVATASVPLNSIPAGWIALEANRHR